MEKRTFAKGLNRLGLIGVLGASLILVGIGTREASAQSAAYMQGIQNNWANDPKISAKDREVHRQGEAIYRNFALEQAEDDARKARWEMEKQTDLLKKIEKQNREKNTSSSYQETKPNNSTTMTPDEVLKSRYGPRYNEYINSKQEMFVSFNEWIDGSNGGEKNKSRDIPCEIIGLEKGIYPQGESINVLARMQNRKGSVVKYNAFRDNQFLFDGEALVPDLSCDWSIPFSKINPKPGEYKFIFTINDQKIGEVNFTVK